jgi:hypothetical protein
MCAIEGGHSRVWEEEGSLARRKKPASAAKNRISQLQYPKEGLASVYWISLLDEMYAALERRRCVPDGLLNHANESEYHDEVEWHGLPPGDYPTRKTEFTTYALEAPSSEDEQELLSRGSTLDDPPKTVGESIAFFLMLELMRLKGSKNAPVRAGGKLPRSTIAFLAWDLLTSYRVSPPGPYLKKLLSLLLEIPRPRGKELNRFAARYQAAFILAEAPDLDDQTIADELGVDRTSVLRWRKERDFQQRVSNIRASRSQRAK